MSSASVAAAAGPTPRRDPAWRGRVGLGVLVAVLAWPMLQWAEFRPWRLLQGDGLAAGARLAAGFWPPATDAAFLGLVARETWRTVAMATAGLVLALLLAVPASLLLTRALSVSALTGSMARLPALARFALRSVLAVLRSVPELVWALVFVRVVGLGPGAGVLAIALTFGGMLGKVYAEILESTEPAATRSLLQHGSGRLQAFAYGLLPAAAPELVSYTVYRWECAIRSSVVLGFVGAGGLGQQIDSSMKMFAGGEVATLLLVFVALAAAADQASASLRRWLA